MNQTLPTVRRLRALRALALALGLAPFGAHAMPRLLEGELRSPFTTAAASAGMVQLEAPTLLAAAGDTATPPATRPAAGDGAEPEPAHTSAGSDAPPPNDAAAPTEPKKPDLTPAPPRPAATESLDFNLLGDAPAPPPSVDPGALKLRRTMLTVHQSLGFGLVALQLGTTILGQLNYSDKFGGPSTGRYQTAHAVTAYSTLGLFAATGLLALLAPKPIERSGGFDRVTLHKIAMFTAAAGMVAQGVLGIATREREGFQNQQNIATTHLVIGYVTLGAVLTGVSALVF